MPAPIEFNLKKLGGTKIWVSRRFEDPSFVEALAHTDRLFDLPGCQVVKDQRKIKVGRLQVAIAGAQRSVYIKRYNSFSFRFRLFSPFCRSGALRSLRGALILKRGRIATVEPIAAVESRSFRMLRHSFFISEEIAPGKTADTYWLETFLGNQERDAPQRRRAFLSRLGSLFRRLHAQRIYHNDLKDANILIANDGDAGSIECFLLDLEGVRQCAWLSERRRIKNLVQLYRTLGRHLSQSQQMFFLKCYLGAAFADTKRKRRLVQALLKSAKIIDAEKANR